MTKIHDWRDIEDAFEHTLLLGNGASLAIDSSFSYGSLLEAAQSAGYITPNVAQIFNYLGTKDFELVLSMLRTAFHINRALAVDEPATIAAYSDVRKALVSTVRDVHPEHEAVAPHLAAIHRFMKRFDTVLSLNYDLIVYWAMLEGNREYGTWFKDCFVNGVLDDDWERMREPYNAAGATLVFYPHGNLILGTTLEGGESKISVERDRDRLLPAVLREWEDSERLPLFVSEGGGAQKQAAISRSGYLGTVYNSVMADLGPSVVVFGCALDENDDHIVRRIARGPARVAKSVFWAGRHPAEVERECADFLARLAVHRSAATVLFFDAQSAGCWLQA